MSLYVDKTEKMTEEERKVRQDPPSPYSLGIWNERSHQSSQEMDVYHWLLSLLFWQPLHAQADANVLTTSLCVHFLVRSVNTPISPSLSTIESLHFIVKLFHWITSGPLWTPMKKWLKKFKPFNKHWHAWPNTWYNFSDSSPFLSIWEFSLWKMSEGPLVDATVWLIVFLFRRKWNKMRHYISKRSFKMYWLLVLFPST